MNNGLILLIVAALVGVIAVGFALAMSRRRQSEKLQNQFGPEYERTVDQYGDRQRAEQELLLRDKRVQAFNLKSLQSAERERFAAQWRQTQSEFVDAPDRAVRDADRLVKEVMEARGYPIGDFEQRAADISVDHANVVTHYRTAHEIALREEKGKATTEDLRQAMVHYRALYDELLQADDTGTPAERTVEKERVR